MTYNSNGEFQKMVEIQVRFDDRMQQNKFFVKVECVPSLAGYLAMKRPLER